MCGVYNVTNMSCVVYIMLAITVPALVLAVYLNNKLVWKVAQHVNKLVWKVAQHVNKLHRLIAALLGQLLKYLLQLLHTSYTVRTA